MFHDPSTIDLTNLFGDNEIRRDYVALSFGFVEYDARIVGTGKIDGDGSSIVTVFEGDIDERTALVVGRWFEMEHFTWVPGVGFLKVNEDECSFHAFVVGVFWD